MTTVLVADDDLDIRELVAFKLTQAGYQVRSAPDGVAALEAARAGGVDLVVLDLMMPGLSGLDVCAELRREPTTADLPVIMLTARAQDQDVATGFAAGADDYVVKPFSFSELLARVRARLRQPAQPSAVVLSGGGLTLDVRTRRVRVGEREVPLSSREFALLETLLRHPGQVLSQVQLLDQVWGYDFDGASNVVETCVRHLRRKVGAERIETLRGAGYRLVVG